jgi:hypothetical protein
MSFLGPLPLTLFAYIAAGAAVLTIGAYIIKMRRRRFEVPFSQLWKRVLEQKDANALWKQLRRLMSLLFILLILGLVMFAALDPTLGAVSRKARSVVILVDASASMKAMDGDKAGKQARLDVAKDRAKALVDSMGGGDLGRRRHRRERHPCGLTARARSRGRRAARPAEPVDRAGVGRRVSGGAARDGEVGRGEAGHGHGL